MRSIKLVSLFLATAVLFLGIGSSISHASPAVFAKDCLPSCESPAKVVIFDALHFDGTIYLHDADVVVSAQAVKAVKEIAAAGQQPVVCQDLGAVVVTSNN